ncbi:CNNM domain-containing protein [Rubripirellula amarantea]|uniref:Magnesium and cobalt efflux protein CorC n=2 Tax=Rubripirellula amarantea TaxID=2527999 RepID=A0A5C5WSW8_9BACT|nr:CNNM domain-containing protein [Rubripirellula amarantea]TWT53251.1 Magnesium and cobalt efflux protein CorC [Rubripirellula amarantea]
MLSLLAQAWPLMLAMGLLILLSAFFSGSEAALFSLSTRDRKLLSRGGLGGRVATALLANPERLLSAILFWNLLINMTYFAIAAILGSRLEMDPNAGRSEAIAFTAVSLLTIIFFSEMLPKSFAVLVPVRLSMLIAVPLDIAVRIVGPAIPLVTRANAAVSRLIWPSFAPEPDIDLADIERAIELGTDDAALLQRERMALRSLVQIAETRVSEWMRPRSKLWLTGEPVQRRIVLEGGIQNTYLMVLDSNREMIIKAIGLRTLRPSQMDDMGEAAEPVIYVPWSAMVSQVLDRLNEDDRTVAVVVNEFGELMGAITIDDILERVLAPRKQDELIGEATIQELGDHRYRVWGLVSIRQLAKHLGVDVDGEGVTTVAGYIGRQNERFARPGDSALMLPYTLTVTEQSEESVWIEVRRHDDIPEVETTS